MNTRWVMLLVLLALPALTLGQHHRRELGGNISARGGVAAPRHMSNSSKVHLANATLAMPDTLTATAGSIVSVPVILALAGDSVAALGAAITATGRILSFTGFAPGPIIPGERFNVNAAKPDSVLLAYTDFGAGPIRQDGVLATLQFRVSPNAEGGDIAKLNFSGVFAIDPQFRSLPIQPISGQVTIVILPVIFSISDTLSGAPGDTVAVPVMLARNEHRIDALGGAIKAGNRLLSYAGFVAGAVIPGPQLNVSAPAPDSVRLAYLNFGGGPIANDGVLVTLFFRLDPSAKPGEVSALTFHGLTASDSTFKKLPVQNLAGKVTVVIRPAEIRGMKWHDLNGNGRKESNEPGLKGWEIRLTGAATQNATTDSLGSYVFMALAPGTYTVAEVLQTGWQRAFPPAPGTHTVVLRPGQALDSLNFGNWRPGSIQGMLWHDKNLDGKKNEDESLLEGWQINLAGPDTLSTNTDAAGNYRFENLAPRTYKISEVLRTKWRQTFPVAPDTAYVVVLASGQHVGDINFANEPPVSVGQEKNPVLPETFVLFQNYPNPFWSGATSRSAGNPSTTIKYGVPRQGRIKLEVINALGMRVAVLTDEVQQPGYYEVKFDMAGLPGGIYFYRLTSPAGLVKTRKLLLVK